MRQKILVGFAALVWLLVFVEGLRADTLDITISNVHKSEGSLMLQVLTEAQFKDNSAPIAAFMQRAATGEMQFRATLPAGTYGLRIMHDVNDNGELDSNFVGIPSEPWAFSNNATGNFGPPSWKDVSFELKGEATQTIQLNK